METALRAAFASAGRRPAGRGRPGGARRTPPLPFAPAARPARLAAGSVSRCACTPPPAAPARVCHPTRLAAEIAATVRRDDRVLAVAARADHRDGRWLLTAFSVLE
ncbi:Rv3235 family protein [Lentzea guizhouensis]|uniref:Rv3235 family protein n=1 Tax=Lentzea guizhouensis TaxID=1586287 RepID=UPI0012B6A3ED|nr:Rv3235 family protein [Lentzea guizhouensis]